MCLNNLHVRIRWFMWAATCTKNWRNANPLRYQLQDEFQTGLWKITLLEWIIASSIPLKTGQKVTHESVNLTLMPIPCTLSNSYTVFERKGRLICNRSHCTISHRLIPRHVLWVDQTHYTINIQLWVLSLSFTIKSSAQTKYVKGN